MDKNIINNNLTDDEIWEMLKPKMEKNRLSAYMFIIPTLENIEGDIKWAEDQVYKANDVHNAIALAYRSGYGRGQKGRPFKIGEKKNGHWEWIKSDEIVLNGTKVRYMKKSKNDNGDRDCWPELGQECIKATPPGWSENEFWVQYEGTSFEFVCKNSSRNCFQKWVEE